MLARAALATGLLLVLASCGRPAPIAPPRAASVALEGRDVVWSSSLASRGAVRYGTARGRYDRVAYPAVKDRADQAFVTSHRVRLLGAGSLDSVFLQVIDQSPSGADAVSGEYAFRLGALAAPALLRWTMIDVGFGDSHLVTFPGSGRRVLVDAGERRDAANVRAFLSDAGVTSLDAVVATHIHEDHLGGLVGEPYDPDDGVLGALPVGAWIDAATHSGTRAAYGELVALATLRGVPRVAVSAGDGDGTRPELAWDPEVRIEVLRAGGGRLLGGATESDWINDDSIVLRLVYRDVGLVLGGDAESPAENALLAAAVPLAAAALKVHHHGAADASEPGYLAAMDPRVGLVPIASVESFGGSLPSGIVMERLRARGMDLYASDRAEPLGIAPAGDAGWNVTLVSDGASVEVRVEPSRSVHWPPEEFSTLAEGGAR